jgi:hypothetical protein
VIKFVSDLWQVGGFLWVLQFPPPIKLEDWTLHNLLISDISNKAGWCLHMRFCTASMTSFGPTIHTGNLLVAVNKYTFCEFGQTLEEMSIHFNKIKIERSYTFINPKVV